MANKDKGWPIGVMVVVFSFFFLFGLATVSKNEVRNEMVQEAMLIEATMGHSTLTKINAKADGWYLHSVDRLDKNTLQDWMADNPTRFEKLQREEKGTTKFHAWLADRRVAFLDLVFWIYRRLALFQLLIPMWLPIGVLACYHGWMSRAIKQTDFGYTSPVINHWARSVMTVITYLTVLLFFSPVALHPWIFPLLLGIWSLSTATAISNIQKRI